MCGPRQLPPNIAHIKLAIVTVDRIFVIIIIFFNNSSYISHVQVTILTHSFGNQETRLDNSIYVIGKFEVFWYTKVDMNGPTHKRYAWEKIRR